MPNFIYSALDAKGEQADGNVAAATEAEAIQKLRGQGLYPIQIAEEGKGKGKAKIGAKRTAVKRKSKNISFGKGKSNVSATRDSEAVRQLKKRRKVMSDGRTKPKGKVVKIRYCRRWNS